MLDLAGVGGRRRLQKCLNQFAPHQINGCPCLPENSGTTAQIFCGADANVSRSNCTVAALTGGRSTSVITAASRPRFNTSCSPTCRELNWPRLGVRIGHQRRSVGIGDRRQSGFILARHDQHEVRGRRHERIAAERNVSFDDGSRRPAEARAAAPCPCPCAKIRPPPESRPAKLGERDMSGR